MRHNKREREREREIDDIYIYKNYSLILYFNRIDVDSALLFTPI
jgi:hypothetical protein